MTIKTNIKRLLLLPLLLLPGLALALCPPHDPLGDTMCLDYTLPTENADGTPLTDLDTLRVYYGFTTGVYDLPGFLEVTDLSVTTFTTSGVIVIPSPGFDGGDVTVFFVMTALDDAGNESVFSNEVMKIKTFIDTLEPKSVIILIGT